MLFFQQNCVRTIWRWFQFWLLKCLYKNLSEKSFILLNLKTIILCDTVWIEINKTSIRILVKEYLSCCFIIKNNEVALTGSTKLAILYYAEKSNSPVAAYTMQDWIHFDTLILQICYIFRHYTNCNGFEIICRLFRMQKKYDIVNKVTHATFINRKWSSMSNGPRKIITDIFPLLKCNDETFLQTMW